uniref:Uncharacterized protein n=1 Tax=Anguilla anguilla TaxID=7936 RepID=A0A0E9W1I2_ANGAN
MKMSRMSARFGGEKCQIL